jgi:EmrB/QacA subfamily drug resistance transporter
MAIPTKGSANPWAVLLVLCMGFFMILLDTTIVNIAIPSIISDLRSTLDQILWVLNAYILVYAVLLITAGRLGDLFGPRNLFALGLAIFILASALCGVAQSTDQLIAARVLQGLGGALLTPQTLAIIVTIFPAERRGAAFGVWGGVAGLAAVAGPVLGGIIVTNLSWRWVFFVNVPIGVAALFATFLIVPDIRPGRRHRLDLVGVALASAGLFAITFGLIEGQRYDWGVITGWLTIPGILAAGVLLLAAFLIWESRQAEPLLPLSIFRDRNFSVMNWVSFAVAFGMLGLFLPLTIYLQSVRGMSALEAGLTILPMPLVAMPLAPLAGRLSDRFGGKYVLMFGTGLFALGMGWVDLAAGPASTWRDFLPGLVLAGVGMGCTFAPMVTVAMQSIQPQMAGAASGMLNTTRQLGGVLGSAVVGAVLQYELARSLHQEAVSRSTALPPELRQRFIDGFTSAVKGGLQVGRGESGTLQQAAGSLPPQVLQQLQQLSHDVFAYGFIDAMRPSLLVGVAVLLLGSISCLAAQRRPGSGARQPDEDAAGQSAPAA